MTQDKLKRAREKLMQLCPFELEEGDGCPFCTGRHPGHDRTCRLSDYEEAMKLLEEAQEELKPKNTYVQKLLPEHRVSSEAVTLTWEGEKLRIPSDSPNYDAARFAVYHTNWEEVLRLGRLEKARPNTIL